MDAFEQVTMAIEEGAVDTAVRANPDTLMS
ncbi:hypothetical protein QF037_000785 [Streptomyces canus]|nr:hypothetical protein [Streptomyces canus]